MKFWSKLSVKKEMLQFIKPCKGNKLHEIKALQKSQTIV